VLRGGDDVVSHEVRGKVSRMNHGVKITPRLVPKFDADDHQPESDRLVIQVSTGAMCREETSVSGPRVRRYAERVGAD
jgi:hypothetical protein